MWSTWSNVQLCKLIWMARMFYGQSGQHGKCEQHDQVAKMIEKARMFWGPSGQHGQSEQHDQMGKWSEWQECSVVNMVNSQWEQHDQISKMFWMFFEHCGQHGLCGRNDQMSKISMHINDKRSAYCFSLLLKGCLYPWIFFGAFRRHILWKTFIKIWFSVLWEGW